MNIRTTHCIAAASALILICATPILAADNSPKKTGTTSTTAKEIDPPLGFWNHAKTDLYVSIDTAGADVADELVIGKRVLQIGGPPPTQGKADDVFLLTKHERRGNSIVATGAFNWDSDQHPIELEITWTAKTVTVKILKNPGYQMFPAGTYLLKKQKRS